MDSASDFLQLGMIVSFQGDCPLLLQLLDLALYRLLVDADDLLHGACLYTPGVAESHREVLLVHGLKTLHGLVLDTFSNLSQLGD